MSEATYYTWKKKFNDLSVSELRRLKIIGRVSMDMLTMDLTDLPETGIGSKVELWGKSRRFEPSGPNAGTIAYKLLCNVKRVLRVYEGAGARPEISGLNSITLNLPTDEPIYSPLIFECLV